MMRPTRPYSIASSADSQRSRSMSSSTPSSGLPVSRAMVWAMRSRALMISWAWIAMSLAGPPAPPLGWWIRKRVFGSAEAPLACGTDR
jgi:hypothetical protein